MVPHCAKVALLLAGAATAAAAAVTVEQDQFLAEVDVGGRQFIVSNISAVITYVSFVVALVMLAGFAYVAFAFRSKSSSHYDRRGFGDNDAVNWIFYNKDLHRFKRSKDIDMDQELAVKLSVLNDSFKKFDMESLGCQMLLSCESAQLETAQHPIYGELTPRIHKLISKTKARDMDDNRIGKLRQAHREGRKDGTSCKKLYGDLCPDLEKKLHKKPAVIIPTKESHKKLAKKQQYSQQMRLVSSSAPAAAAAAAYRTFGGASGEDLEDYDDTIGFPKKLAVVPDLAYSSKKKKQYFNKDAKKKYRGAHF